ncbi:hypothetical protein EV184_12652 [Sinorhizobium americanum]|uniref:Uncharacterized protein n=1 Tax=Sinorhizobium americanum TaxID=194963 RepID=A0A4R2B4A9_9HYPH|nr:hypothetical protein EV184_12652 [Sinorhizobium americanum]
MDGSRQSPLSEGDEQVSLDTNHPLAGKDLIFDVTVVDVLG